MCRLFDQLVNRHTFYSEFLLESFPILNRLLGDSSFDGLRRELQTLVPRPESFVRDTKSDVVTGCLIISRWKVMVVICVCVLEGGFRCRRKDG